MSNEVVWVDTCKCQIPKKNTKNNKMRSSQLKEFCEQGALRNIHMKTLVTEHLQTTASENSEH